MNLLLLVLQYTVNKQLLYYYQVSKAPLLGTKILVEFRIKKQKQWYRFAGDHFWDRLEDQFVETVH